MGQESADLGERGSRVNLKEINLFERAVRAGWLIPDEARRLIPADLLEMFKTSKSSRARIALARCLDAMQKTELASVEVALKVQTAETADGDLSLENIAVEAGKMFDEFEALHIDEQIRIQEEELKRLREIKCPVKPVQPEPEIGMKSEVEPPGPQYLDENWVDMGAGEFCISIPD